MVRSPPDHLNTGGRMRALAAPRTGPVATAPSSVALASARTPPAGWTSVDRFIQVWSDPRAGESGAGPGA
ncbi:unnamed protein product [Gadus morhua 'NCC']